MISAKAASHCDLFKEAIEMPLISNGINGATLACSVFTLAAVVVTKVIVSGLLLGKEQTKPAEDNRYEYVEVLRNTRFYVLSRECLPHCPFGSIHECTPRL